MSEKKVEEHGASKDVDYGVGNVHNTNRRKSSAVDPAVLAGEIFDERYETTQRGLKSRYFPNHPSSAPAYSSFTAMRR
jgi:amino acid transporter